MAFNVTPCQVKIGLPSNPSKTPTSAARHEAEPTTDNISHPHDPNNELPLAMVDLVGFRDDAHKKISRHSEIHIIPGVTKAVAWILLIVEHSACSSPLAWPIIGMAPLEPSGTSIRAENPKPTTKEHSQRAEADANDTEDLHCTNGVWPVTLMQSLSAWCSTESHADLFLFSSVLGPIGLKFNILASLHFYLLPVLQRRVNRGANTIVQRNDIAKFGGSGPLLNFAW